MVKLAEILPDETHQKFVRDVKESWGEAWARVFIKGFLEGFIASVEEVDDLPSGLKGKPKNYQAGRSKKKWPWDQLELFGEDK